MFRQANGNKPIYYLFVTLPNIFDAKTTLKVLAATGSLSSMNNPFCIDNWGTVGDMKG